MTDKLNISSQQPAQQRMAANLIGRDLRIFSHLTTIAVLLI